MKVEIALVQAHRLLAQRPVCLLSARYRGRENVMPVAWVTPISMEPPMLGVAVHPSRFSHDLLMRSEEFVLNIPGRPMLEQVMACGSVSGSDVDKIATYHLRCAEGQRVSAPWIDDCLAHLECVVITVLSPGDHSLFMGQVVGAWAEEEAFGGLWRTDVAEELQPLIHLRGGTFGTLSTTTATCSPQH